MNTSRNVFALDLVFCRLFWWTVLPSLFCAVVVGCEKEDKGAKKEGSKLHGEISKPLKERERLGFAVRSSAAAFSPDGKLLLVGFERLYGREPTGAVLIVFDVRTGKQIRTVASDERGVCFVAFFPDGKQALSTAGDEFCKIWDVEKGSLVRQFRGNSFGGLPLTPDGAKALNCGPLELWDLKAGKRLHAYPEHKNPITSVAISPDGKLAIFGCNSFVEWPGGKDNWTNLQIWSIGKGKVQFSSGKESGGLAGPGAFSPDGKSVASNKWTRLAGAKRGVQTRVVLWQVETGKEIRDFANSTAALALAFTSDGKNVVTIEYVDSSSVLKRYDVKTGKKLLAANIGDGIAGGGVMAFSRDGNLVFLGRRDLNLEIWDTSTGQMLRKLVPEKLPFPNLERLSP
jgi:WD40 repeat protein